MCIINVELARCGEEQLEFLLSSARNYNLRQSTENKIYIRFLRNNQYFSFVYKSMYKSSLFQCGFPRFLALFVTSLKLLSVLFFDKYYWTAWPSVHQILVKAPVKLLILTVPF